MSMIKDFSNAFTESMAAVCTLAKAANNTAGIFNEGAMMGKEIVADTRELAHIKSKGKKQKRMNKYKDKYPNMFNTDNTNQEV